MNIDSIFSALYANIRQDPMNEHNQWKSEHSECQRSWGSGGVLRLQPGVRGQSTFRKFSGSKEHLDWLKRNLNVDEIITVHEYKH